MDNLLLAATGINYMWYAVPLIITVSLVYSATRHEETGSILQHSVRIGGWILGFMAAIFAVLLLVSWQG